MGSSETIVRVSTIMVAERESVTESMSVLTVPATHGILNSELTNCPMAAVLEELAAQWQLMMKSLQPVEQETVITEPGQR